MFNGLSAIFKLCTNIASSVHSIFNVGTYDYAYIYVNDQSVFYKTAAYPANTLALNMQVDMNFDSGQPEPYNTYITSSAVQIGVYADKLETENFDMPLTSQYGMPVHENEILFFSSQAHFDEFSLILENFAKNPYEEMIDLLHVFEDEYLGFTSFNSMLEREFNWEDGEFTDEEMELRQFQDYFKDYIIKTLVNEYGELGIGNEVLTMTSDSKGEIIYTYVLEATNLEEIDLKRQIDIYDPNFTSMVPYVGKLYKGDQIYGKGQATIVYHSTPAGESKLTYLTKTTLELLECQPLKRKLILEMTTKRTYPDDGTGGLIGLDASNFSGTALVDWGDGTTEIVTLGAVGNYKQEYYLLHTFPAPSGVQTETYIKIVYNFNSETAPTQAINIVDSTFVRISNNACQKSEIIPNKETHYFNNNNNKMVAEGYVKNFYKWKTIYSGTTSYKKKNNGNWSKEKAQIQANVFYVFRNSNCNVEICGQEIDSGYKKHIQSKKSRSYYPVSDQYSIGNGDTYTVHTCAKNGMNVGTIIWLNGCQ